MCGAIAKEQCTANIRIRIKVISIAFVVAYEIVQMCTIRLASIFFYFHNSWSTNKFTHIYVNIELKNSEQASKWVWAHNQIKPRLSLCVYMFIRTFVRMHSILYIHANQKTELFHELKRKKIVLLKSNNILWKRKILFFSKGMYIVFHMNEIW